MDATSVRLIVNFKAVVATLVLAALLLAGLAATFGFGPFGHQYGTDRAARQATELTASTAPRPAAVAPSASQPAPADTMSVPAAGGAVAEAQSLPRKPAQLAHPSKRRAHRFNSAPQAVAIDAASHQGEAAAEVASAHVQQDASSSIDASTARVAHTTTMDSTVAVVESPEQYHESPDRVAVQEPVSQHEKATVSLFDNPTELHPLSNQELASVSAANGAVAMGLETPVT